MARVSNRSNRTVMIMCGTVALVAFCIIFRPGSVSNFSLSPESASYLHLSNGPVNGGDGKISGDPGKSNKEQSSSVAFTESSQIQDDRVEARAMQEIETADSTLTGNGEIRGVGTKHAEQLGNPQLPLAHPDQSKKSSEVGNGGLVEQESPESEETAQSDMEATSTTQASSNESIPEQVESDTEVSPVAQQRPKESASETSEEAVPVFYTYPTVGNVDLLCKNLTNCDDCQRVKPLLSHMVSNSALGRNGTELFLIPMDPLAIFRKKPYMYQQMLSRVLNEITHHRNFLRYGGSDHLFVCLADGCKDVLRDITERHPIGRDGRAMWIGREGKVQQIKKEWPCPNRVFSVPHELLNGLGWKGQQGCRDMDGEMMVRGFNGLLRKAAKHIEGMNRWSCSKKFWKNDLSALKGTKHQGCMAIKQHKICISGIPKCASSTMNILVRRMLGIPSWNNTHGHTHGAGNGIKWVNAKKDFDQYRRIMEGTDWLNIAVVREPAARFLSAFVDKIVKKKEFGRVGFRKSSWMEEPSLEWVINRFLRVKEKGKMGNVDLHFRPMHFFASMGAVRYDFIARVGTLADDIEAILKSLDLWELYGASGWGVEGNLSFKEAKGRNVQKDDVQYYTEDMLRRVHHIYKRDYDLLGFSMADEWGVEPS
ncbi:hypothetical protein BSKO_07590 [Bryopsis sp. KO-2023]|nr:hypothetical protein BSKO_07590 [Bryopsis sp. KO-2023]